jgi:hypothetical protein
MLKRLTTTLALAAALLAGATTGAHAATISFSPVTQNVNIGDTAFVDLVISGLDLDEEVGSFDVDVTYNDSVVGFVGYTLGSGLGTGADIIDLSLGDLGGLIDIAVLSLLDELDLGPLQGASFVLARLEFTALANGVSPLVYAQSIFADGAGLELDVDTDTGAIRVGEVPEPVSLLLFGAGAAALAIRRRRQA